MTLAKKLQLAKESASQQSIVVLVNNRKNLHAPLSYLEPHYSLHVVTKVSQLALAIAAYRPKIIILSWTLAKTDVPKLLRLLTQKFNLKCIVVAEDSSKRTTSSLMNSGFPHFFLSPVNGESLHRKIQALSPTDKKETVKITSAEKADVPPDLVWEQVPDPQDPNKRIWRGSSKDKNYGGAYFVRGERPVYHRTKNEWTFSRDGRPVLFQENIGSVEQLSEEEFSKLLRQLQKESFETLEAQNLEKFDRPVHEAIPQPKAQGPSAEILHYGKNSGETVLSKAVKNSYVESGKGMQTSTPINESTSVSKVTISSIKSSQFEGYLICISSKNEHQRPFMEKMRDILVNELGELGEVILSPINIFEVEIALTPFLNWVKEKSDFFVMGHDADVALAFFSAPLKDPTKEVEDKLSVNVTDHIVPNSNLEFDLYLHLPSNRKFILYLKKGQKCSLAHYDKFVRFSMTTLYINKDQKNEFFKYIAKNFLTKTQAA